MAARGNTAIKLLILEPESGDEQEEGTHKLKHRGNTRSILILNFLIFEIEF